MTIGERKSRLVFVDPEDENVHYWWPALIVPEGEFEMFRETMDSDISTVAPEERLVCYFEDGSLYIVFYEIHWFAHSSVVPCSAMVPFCPEKEPFQSYARNIRRFASDLGVTRAVKYYTDGDIPDGFKWLRLIETGFVDVTIDPPKKSGKIDLKASLFKKSSTKSKSPSVSGKKKGVPHKHDTKPEKSHPGPLESIPVPKFNEPKKFVIISHLLPAAAIFTRK